MDLQHIAFIPPITCTLKSTFNTTLCSTLIPPYLPNVTIHPSPSHIILVFCPCFFLSLCLIAHSFFFIFIFNFSLHIKASRILQKLHTVISFVKIQVSITYQLTSKFLCTAYKPFKIYHYLLLFSLLPLAYLEANHTLAVSRTQHTSMPLHTLVILSCKTSLFFKSQPNTTFSVKPLDSLSPLFLF